MTGFGKVTAELPSKKVTVEIKALNSKQLDLSTRIPSIYKEKEMQIRSLLLQSLERGKVEFNIFVEYIGKDTPTQINLAAVENYYNQIKDIANRLNIGLPADWFQTLLRMPDVIKTEAQEVNEEEWNVVEKAIKEAIGHLCDFRIQEGAMLQKLFEQKIANISRLLSEVEPYEKERIEKIKARIMDNLEKIAGQDYDKNRFEQEMIYYIEKLDVNEEKNRLDNHLKYYISTMESGHGQGKQPCRDAKTCRPDERRTGTNQRTSIKRIIKTIYGWQTDHILRAVRFGQIHYHQFPAEAESEPAFFHLGYQPGSTWYGKGRSGILFPYTG